jgi:uncharacterized protein YecE (DUF72 family)
MVTRTQPQIRVGIGGWTHAPWRGAFYPEDLTQSASSNTRADS